MFRPLSTVIVAALALTACTGGDDAASPAPTSVPVTTQPVPDEAATAAAPEAAADVATVDEPPEWSVSIAVTTEGFGDDLDETVGWTGDPDAAVEGGPFGSFGSCSGLREHVGAYSVFVSGAEPVDSVTVWTADRVTGAGIFDAEVRVERSGTAPLTASGTITILDGLQRGEFLAFGAEGGRIEGRFECVGTEPPSPLETSDDNGGAVDAVEVFVLLREGDGERVVGLAADAGSAAVCPAVSDEPADTVLRVEDGSGLGAITAFELDAAPVGTVRLRVAGVDYEFADVAVELGDAETSGTFSGASLDGTSIDGAFRCS